MPEVYLPTSNLEVTSDRPHSISRNGNMRRSNGPASCLYHCFCLTRIRGWPSHRAYIPGPSETWDIHHDDIIASTAVLKGHKVFPTSRFAKPEPPRRYQPEAPITSAIGDGTCDVVEGAVSAPDNSAASPLPESPGHVGKARQERAHEKESKVWLQGTQLVDRVMSEARRRQLQ